MDVLALTTESDMGTAATEKDAAARTGNATPYREKFSQSLPRGFHMKI